ncbi:MAG: inositol 2-dehydrogenase [Anaerolineae bacterium]|nr:inositol 2-dehydrogenase [Anaerolineae bacterium]
MASKKLRVGLVGTGRIGRVHAQTLKQRVPEVELVTVTDVNQASAQQCADQFNIPHVAKDLAEILSDKSIDAVVICSSTDTHAPFISQAAQAGKHIFCEKPIAANLQIIDQALDVVKKAGVSLMIGFNRRFDPNHARIKQAIEGGEIGTPHLLHIISRDPAPPPIEYVKVSGGMFFDMTIHDFDMVRFLLGEVEEVYAAAGVMVDPAIGAAGDIDTAVITLKFKNGAIGTIDNSRKAVYGYDQRVEVFGSKGSAKSENIYPDAVTLSTAETVRQGLPLNFFMDRYLTSYQNELAAFAQAVANGKQPPVTGADGRAPVVMAMAAMKSVKDNRPVKLSEIE